MGGRVSNAYLSGDYPKFLRPDKVYPTATRFDDGHLRGAMEEALDRYERDLLTQEGEKQRLREAIVIAQARDVKAIQEQRAKKERKMEENRLFLKLQIEEA